MTAPKQDPPADWQERIVCDPEILGGKPIIKGTGISVALVNQLLRRGYTLEAIIDNYLHVTEADVEACRRYGAEQREREYAEFVRKTPKRTPEEVADWRDRIVCDPRILVGKPTIKGTRISVELVTDRLAGGWTVSQILDNYSHIRAEDVDACVKYQATGASLSRMPWDEYDAWMANAEPTQS